MVSCQEPSPLNGSKHSQQCHPHDAYTCVLSMGVEARCRPSKSTAHCCHMKRQPFLCNGCPCRGHCHCHRCCHLPCCCRLRCRCRCSCRRNRPLPLPLLAAIAIAVTVNHQRDHLCWAAVIAVAVALAVGHCRLRHRQPLQLPLLLAITVIMPLAISESCCLGMAKIVFNQLK